MQISGRNRDASCVFRAHNRHLERRRGHPPLDVIDCATSAWRGKVSMGPRNSIPTVPRAISRGRSGDLMEPQARGELRQKFGNSISPERGSLAYRWSRLDAMAESRTVLATSSCFIYSTYPRVGLYGEGKRGREALAIPRIYNARRFTRIETKERYISLTLRNFYEISF